MDRILVLAVLLCCCGQLGAQSMELTNGRKVRKINPGDYVELFISSDTAEIKSQSQNLIGHFTTYSNDSLHLRLVYSFYESSWDKLPDEKRQFPSVININERIAIADIYRIDQFKSAKSKNRKEFLSITGGLLFFTGLITAANALLVDDRNSKDILLISGAVQVGASISLGILGSSRKYRFKSPRLSKNWMVIN
ncbi:MAG: hypothetical protein AAFV95_24410 [Bacteroidota bacterium]